MRRLKNKRFNFDVKPKTGISGCSGVNTRKAFALRDCLVNRYPMSSFLQRVYFLIVLCFILVGCGGESTTGDAALQRLVNTNFKQVGNQQSPIKLGLLVWANKSVGVKLIGIDFIKLYPAQTQSQRFPKAVLQALKTTPDAIVISNALVGQLLGRDSKRNLKQLAQKPLRIHFVALRMARDRQAHTNKVVHLSLVGVFKAQSVFEQNTAFVPWRYLQTSNQTNE